MADQEARIDLGIVGLGPAEHIGRGGFADVYRAEQLSLRRTVAVKVLRAQASDPDAEARFERECHAIGAVSDHPHIVGVHEGGFTRNGRAYLVMEYLPGGSLYERLVDDGPLPVPEIVDIGIKIGKALAVAHRTGVLHRDVKPANIMISAYGEPALGDFGIARVEGGHQTATGLVTASFAHAAPEVLEGHVPSAAADIYSLGSTIFELMTGQPPYYNPDDESIWPLMKRILSEPMPTPESVGMSPRLGAVFTRATARDVTERYSEVDELVDDLVGVASDPLAVTVYPPEGGGFVPAPRPPGGRKGRIDLSAEAPTSFSYRLPPAAEPDLRLARAADTEVMGIETENELTEFNRREDPVGSGLDNPPRFDGDLGSAESPMLAQYPAESPVQDLSSDRVGDGSLNPILPTQSSESLVPSPVSPVVAVDGSTPATTMDLPPAAVVRPPPPESRRWLAPLVGLAAAIVVMAGALFIFTDVADPVIEALDPAAPTVGSDTAVPGASGFVLGDARIEIVDAPTGPLVVGQLYEVKVTGIDPGRLVQLIVDSSSSGSPIEVATDGLVQFEAPAGRHSLAVAEPGSDSELTSREISNTIAFYAQPADGPAQGYRVTLASIAIGSDSWATALASYDRFVADGHGPIELIASDDAPALTPGYWTISVTGFDADVLAAEAYCARFELETPTDCYVSFIDGSSS